MSYLVFDAVRRYLEYRGYTVKHVQNFTDIDDKIIDRANQTGHHRQGAGREVHRRVPDDMAALNVQPAHVYPRATEEVGPIIAVDPGPDRARASPTRPAATSTSA